MAAKTNGNTQILWPDGTDLQNKRFKNAGGFGFGDYTGDVNARVYPTYAEFVRNGDILTVSAPVEIGRSGTYLNFYNYLTGKLHSDVIDFSQALDFTAYDVQDAANFSTFTRSSNELDIGDSDVYADLTNQDVIVVITDDTLPTGSLANTPYIIKKTTGTKIKIFANLTDYNSNTNVTLSGAGTGTHTLYRVSTRPSNAATAVNASVYISSNFETLYDFGNVILPPIVNIFDGYILDVVLACNNFSNANGKLSVNIRDGEFANAKFAHDDTVRTMEIKVNNSIGISGDFTFTKVKAMFKFNEGSTTAGKWYILDAISGYYN